jgi:hypothetical protein
MKFLKDSYNGLFVVLLKPYMPKGKTLAVLVGGVLIGLLWAYAISPTVYYDADPRALHQSWQDEWVKLLADRYAGATNTDVSGNITDLLARVDDPLGIVDRLIASPGEEANQAKLQAIRPLAEAAEPNAVKAPQPSAIGQIVPYILAPIVVVVLGTIVAILWGMFIYPNLIEPLVKRGQKASPEVVQARQARADTAKLMETKKTDFSATSNLGPPLMQKMSSYTPGYGTYDESYTIEDEQERFLGECGALISETVGTGDPAKAAAIEVWLFDKDDFVRTVTKVFVSEYAYNDPAMRSKLEAKGDLVLAQPGASVAMETNTLRLQARIVDMQYGTGPLPPNSYFEKMTIELAAWRKDPSGAVSPTPAPAVPIPQVNVSPAPIPPQPTQPGFQPRQQPAYQPPVTQPIPPSYQPPMTQPIPPQPTTPAPQQPAVMPPQPIPPASTPAPNYTSPSPLRPANAPQRPAPPAPNPDDDPFGGTGDFTPIT